MINYFAFIDESGNLSTERYFGLGMLLINEVGPLYDVIKPYYDKVRDIARIQKEKTVNDLLASRRYEELAVIAKSSKKFELKFKFVNFTNNIIYKEIINTYFRFPNCRFSAAIIDRQDPNFKPNEAFSSPWYMYMSYAAMLLASNINNLGECRICVLADDLTKSRNIQETFEQALVDKIYSRLKQDGIERTIFNVARLESHSSLMLQLVDILLGCVMYDFKKKTGLIAKKLVQRQELVVAGVREILGRNKLSEHFTANQPSYFNVWKVKWEK
jgi:hypothetical protein